MFYLHKAQHTRGAVAIEQSGKSKVIESYLLSVVQFYDPFMFHVHTHGPLSSVTLSQRKKPNGLAKK